MSNTQHFVYNNAFIENNPNLRTPQLHGYLRIYKHFMVDNKKEHAVVVLPTGVGKTGLMAIAPYNISKGKVLIIAPQLTIKDTLINALDPNNPENFWRKTNIFNDTNDMPTLIEFEPKITTKDILDLSDIVVVNIQKLQERLETSPLNFLPKDYFDMIIIDEAHHSAAQSWINTTNYFNEAKVLKVTATPIRTDKKEIKGELVYRYKLSQAMYHNYVKSLENFEYIPEELYMTIDNDLSKQYTADELIDLGIKDADWISRSVAFSDECSRSVVKKSKELLIKKRQGTDVPHKIIAVASNIEQANNIANLYESEGLKSCVIHSKLPDQLIDQIKKEIEKHNVDVVVNVAMLGEGYDHKYLSIGAIFRAYRNILPYAQFVGRVLRAIPAEEVKKASDNIAEIVVHKNLYLDNLWEVFKEEIHESEIIKGLSDIELEYGLNQEPSRENEKNPDQIGMVLEIGQGEIIGDVYLDTELIRKRREEETAQDEKIKTIMETLNIDKAAALKMINAAKHDSSSLKRPDLLKKERMTDIDSQIREELVPEILSKFDLEMHDLSIQNCALFKGQFFWIKNKGKNNGALLAMYMNTYLQKYIGYSRKKWTLDDYVVAGEQIPKLQNHVEFVIKSYLKKTF